MATLDNLVARALQECPSLMNVTAVNAVRRMAIDFLRSSEVWQAEFTYTLTAATTDLDLSDLVPAGSEVSRVTLAYLLNTPLSQVSPDQMLRIKRNQISSGTPRYYIQRQQNITLYPSDSVDREIVLNVVLIPTADSNAIDDGVLEEWGEGIISAALFSLMSMTGKPWTNPQSANHYRERYYNYHQRARGQAVTGGGTEQQRFNKFI